MPKFVSSYLECVLFISKTLWKFNMPRKSVKSADNICYVCSEMAFASQKRFHYSDRESSILMLLGCKIGDKDKRWAPHFCYNTCASKFRSWLNNKSRSMPFAVPMIWREQINHWTSRLILHGTISAASRIKE